MKLIFASADLLAAYSKLTDVARCYTPPRYSPETGEAVTDIFQLMEAAVMFTTQLAIAGTGRDQVEAHTLERTLISELGTWRDDEASMKLHFMTYDVQCVVGGLERAALRVSLPPQLPVRSVVKYAVEIIPRNLTVAAVALTTQLAIEAGSEASEMRDLERALVALLEEPWELGALPLSVDPHDGEPWKPPPG